MKHTKPYSDTNTQVLVADALPTPTNPRKYRQIPQLSDTCKAMTIQQKVSKKFSYLSTTARNMIIDQQLSSEYANHRFQYDSSGLPHNYNQLRVNVFVPPILKFTVCKLVSSLFLFIVKS